MENQPLEPLLAHLTPPQREALKHLQAGATVTAAAKAAGVHRSTIYEWRHEHPAFSCALYYAKRDAAHAAADDIRELATLAIDTIRQILTSDKASASVKLKAAQYVLQNVAEAPKQHLLSVTGAEITPPAEAQPPQTPQNATSSQQNPTQSGTFERIRQTPRNAPCPCRSGEKFKRCCGKAAPPVLGPPPAHNATPPAQSGAPPLSAAA